MLNMPWLCTSCSIHSLGYEMTSPKHVSAIGDVNMDTQESSIGEMALFLLFLRVPFPIRTPLRCIVSHGSAKATLKWNQSSAPQSKAQALQTSRHGVSGDSTQSPRCTESLVASFCHVNVGNCISGPEVCFQHY